MRYTNVYFKSILISHLNQLDKFVKVEFSVAVVDCSNHLIDLGCVHNPPAADVQAGHDEPKTGFRLFMLD